MQKVIVIGAGLCGSLLSIRLAQRGYQVYLYEKRGDMRQSHVDAGRSINLALSKRGLMALERVGLQADILEHCVPMHGRMIHTKSGKSWLSPYSGRKEDYINSVSRSGLNIALLNLAEAYDNVSIQFNASCKKIELETATAHLQDRTTGREWTDTGSIVIGTDGAGSAVRKSMMGQTTRLLFNYSQHFLRHGYKELTIHPDATGGYQIEKNALHIWPRDAYMIIALPNLDGSFTVTMFHPFEGKYGFNQLKTPEQVRGFFETEYPELIPYMPNYVEEYFENPVGTLGTIRCYPWQAYGKALIMGDASHAIVPFYGQGMNASFEDVRVFDDVLDEYEGNWEQVFEVFQERRVPNANAIADLALDNFIEMQDKVNDEDFIKKRELEMQLEQTFPDYYSKYSLVTFQPQLPYQQALQLGRAQDNLLLQLVNQSTPPELSEVHRQLQALQEVAIS
ncbi:MAG: NAD(P)/FAD-dependent oxidoreductase [Bacteroidota bacterium]